jgi:hypothetical protein
MGESQGNEKFADLREALRRLDSVLNFARRLLRDSGDLPPGLVEDFLEARRETEKAFVFVYDQLDDRLERLLREFLQATKSIHAGALAANADKLSKRARSALNQLVIFGGGEVGLTGELGEVRFHDEDPHPQAPPPARPVASPPSRRFPARTLAAIVLIGVLGAVALAVAILVIPWSGTPINEPGNRPVVIADNRPPANLPTGNEPLVVDDTPFDAEAAGYISRLSAAPLTAGINPLEADPANLPPGELTWLLLGYEELLHTLEPGRLAFPPEETRRRLRRFGQSAERSQDDWIERRKPLLDAFIEHVKQEQQLVLYPPESAGTKVLVSDVLYSVGGGRFSLVVTIQVLAQASNAPIRLIAPLGPERPLLAVDQNGNVVTYNGETFGLREGRQPVLILS